MGAVYWSIPLFVVVIMVAVIPLLHGTLKHRQWEEAEQASWAQATAAGHLGLRASVPVAAEVSDDRSPFELAREEARALLVRLEQLRELLVPEDAFATDMEPAANTVD
jgi:hypothetical protein